MCIRDRGDDGWEEWKLEDLVDNMRRYVDRNPLTAELKRTKDKRDDHKKDEKLYNTREVKKKCLFCEKETHLSSNCDEVTHLTERKAIFIAKKLCFNCGGEHRASQCRSQRGCSICKSKHHTSLCDRTEKNPLMLTPKKGVIYPVAVARVNGKLT